MRGRDDVADHRHEPLAGRRIGVRSERQHRRGILRRQREDPVELCERALGHDRRGHDARRDGLAGDLGRRVQERRERAEARLVAVEPIRRVGPLHGRDLGDHRAGAVHVVHDLEPVDPVLEGGEGPRADGFEHVRVELRGLVELRPVDRGELGERPSARGVLCRATVLARVREPVVEAFVADVGAGQRLSLQEALPEAIDELADLVVRRHGSLLRICGSPSVPGARWTRALPSRGAVATLGRPRAGGRRRAGHAARGEEAADHRRADAAVDRVRGGPGGPGAGRARSS